MKQPQVKRLTKDTVTKEDFDYYKKVAEESNIQMLYFSAVDLGLDSPIITITTRENEEEELEHVHLVKPRINKNTGPQLVYFERDTKNPDKIRKTVRAKSVVVETDNMGFLEFSADKEAWKDMNDFMSDEGMLECVYVQRLIDAINGIDITHSSRRYNNQVVNPEKMGRNDRIMMQSSSGESIFIKNKHREKYENKGYKVI